MRPVTPPHQALAPTPWRSRSLNLSGLAGAFAILAVLCLLSVSIGTRTTSLSEIVAGLSGSNETIAEAAVSLRVPRTLLAVLAGAALGVAGCVMQGVTRNPLADPGILGVNTGAALAVVIGIAWFGMSDPQDFLWSGIVGAGLTAVFVYTIGSLGRDGATPLKLALAGTATAITFSSLVVAIILPRADIAGGIQSWQIGGVGGATLSRTLSILPVLGAGFAISLLSARKLNLLALGEDMATGLGERVAVARLTAAAGAILLCGAATAVCGPIAFVGLVVPHVCRLLAGVDYRWLLPFSALGGAGLLVAADILGRIVARPAEIDVGIVTALIGAPFFIWIVRARRVRAL